ncbi:hypothetical protein A2U01_0116157, partial [Trifolium medium]|nr:hypothetical protein [Trifolium medium]
GTVSAVKLSRTCTSSASITCDGSAINFLNWDTSNTSCRFDNDGGNAIR